MVVWCEEGLFGGGVVWGGEGLFCGGVVWEGLFGGGVVWGEIVCWCGVIFSLYFLKTKIPRLIFHQFVYHFLVIIKTLSWREPSLKSLI